MNQKIYLDLNIYYNIHETNNKGFPKIKELFLKSKKEFYYSHGITEELIGLNSYNHMSSLIDEITKKRVILPVKDNFLTTKVESMERSIDRCLKTNTKETIKQTADLKFNNQRINRETNKEVFPKDYGNISSKNAHQVWETEIIKNAINNYLPVLNEHVKEACKELYEIQLKTLSFDELIGLTNDPEVPQLIFDPIIEILSDMLNDCGYGYDKSEETTNSGIYDTAHLNMGRYCDLILTCDKRFKMKGEAIYSLLNIGTKIAVIPECKIESRLVEVPIFSNEDIVIEELNKYV